ncbi:low molecular weight phosphatase family protein [Arthrobacter sp. FW306-05-C]|uniref:arsenate reductase/protein-tyrosine-phosphatase family protein n=1 Tax=Arthrobacter TaxID=1663 RepID=UPI001EF00935|nr:MULTISPECIES: low molecular weight phosphatase family protein [Arthrobacter]MDP9987945.1 protein-tyrosine phosphatase [Arthrobacter oryzae]UKA66028.1 low molecular weight phosphatase family protein [Arthrobacter sp. FW306-05-C]UKA70386.1 low molecular weight phosphatase family protein [Arthrobacter sp. FW306-06-A]UKA74688.1 low molecular weight phosphatase family protein [Arthrobacter sp. FW306-07-I]
MDTSAPVRILTVCTGNICRSPVAERLLQAGLDQVVPGGFEVSSAGTRALVGQPMQPISADIVRTFGGNPEGFAARQLTPTILRGVDLVLTMTSGHRGEVLQLDASLLKRTFTIREFARMLNVLDQRAAENDTQPAGPQEAASDDESRLAANAAFWRGLPARAAGVRHLSLPADPAENDIVDPYRRSPEVYREMEDQLAPAIVSILRHARLNAPVSPDAAQL